MFRVGDVTTLVNGQSVRILSIDAGIKVANGVCDILGAITQTGSSFESVGMWGSNLKWHNIGHNTHNLVSNEPNEEEMQLINNIIGTMQEFGDRDANTETSLLKIIRQIRKK